MGSIYKFHCSTWVYSQVNAAITVTAQLNRYNIAVNRKNKERVQKNM